MQNENLNNNKEWEVQEIIYIKLREYVMNNQIQKGYQKFPTMHDKVKKEYSKIYNPLQKNILFLIDGFDEFSDPPKGVDKDIIRNLLHQVFEMHKFT